MDYKDDYYFTEYVLFSSDLKEKLDLNLSRIPYVKQNNETPSDICLYVYYIEKIFQNKCKMEHEGKQMLIKIITHLRILPIIQIMEIFIIHN